MSLPVIVQALVPNFATDRNVVPSGRAETTISKEHGDLTLVFTFNNRLIHWKYPIEQNKNFFDAWPLLPI
jgi:hypothetical protein